MLQALVSTASRFVGDFYRTIRRETDVAGAARPFSRNGQRAARYQPLKRVILTDGVGRTLFEEYEAHRRGARGDEETGWMLLGVRDECEATVLATLPAGTERDAGVSHVQFNSQGQALGSRIVRQKDKRLAILGVVHTHPGSLRHPSDGDFRGDSAWVGQLRGGEGVFGIGTADNDCPADGTTVAYQPRPHVQTLGEMCLSWYALGKGDRKYRPIPVELTLGPDLARPLHLVWPVIERHADRLDRLFRQQVGMTFEVAGGPDGPTLAATIPLADPGSAVRLLLGEKDVGYLVIRGGEPFAADPRDARIDRGVYLLLAELAAQAD